MKVWEFKYILKGLLVRNDRNIGDESEANGQGSRLKVRKQGSRVSGKGTEVSIKEDQSIA